MRLSIQDNSHFKKLTTQTFHPMSDKLKILQETPAKLSFIEKEALWNEKEKISQATQPLKNLKSLPKMAGITPKTARFLKIKSLFYLIRHDEKKIFTRFFFKRPLTYSFSLLRSYFTPQSFTRKDDLFFYGMATEEEFKQAIASKDSTLLIGFSYCHKPLECPSGRFTDKCQNNSENPVCNQCFIGKCSYLLKNTKAKIVYIPTIHYIGEKIFEAVHENPKKNVYFLITACEMSLTMFADWGNMIKAKGIGIRLDGRICNTMKAFELSENGIKPGLTVVLDATKQKMLDIMQSIHKDACDEKV